MRRLLTAVAVALTFLVFAPAAAHAQEGLCTQSPYEDIDGYSVSGNELDELNTAMNALGARGAEVHIVMLQSFPDSITDVRQYDRQIVQQECPELYVKNGDASEPKPDLLMLVLSKDEKAAGGIIGGNWRRFHNADNFVAVGRSYFQDDDFAGGVTAYLHELDNRIADNQPATGGSQGSRGGSSDPEVHINWGKVGLVIAWISVVLGVVVMILIVVIKVRDKRRRHGRRDEIMGRNTGLLTTYMLADDSGSTVGMAMAWIDQLPDTDDADLRALRDQLVEAHGRVVDLSSEDAKQRLKAAQTDDALDAAETQVDDLEAAIAQANQAKRALDARHEQLQQMQTAFDSLVEDITAALTNIRALIATRGGEGYVVQDYTARVDALTGDFAAARASSEGGAVVTADSKAQAVLSSVRLLTTEIDVLPKRGPKIKERVATLRQLLTTVGDLLTEGRAVLRRLKPAYDRSNWSDLDGIITTAEKTLTTVDTHLTSAERKADSKDPKDLANGDHSVSEAQRLLDGVRDNLTTTVGREELLEELADTLGTQVDQLVTDVQGLSDFVGDAPEGFIKSGTVRDVTQLVHDAEGLQRNLRASKPAYITVQKHLAHLTTQYGQVDQRAQSEHEDATEQVRRAQRRAQSRLDEARRYQSYSGGRFSTADDLFTGTLVGMSLQQQLDHWGTAYDRADDAYSWGHDNQPDTSSYGSNWGGGSDSSDWGSSGGFDTDTSSGGSDSSNWG